jgi:hypothetical protein
MTTRTLSAVHVDRDDHHESLVTERQCRRAEGLVAVRQCPITSRPLPLVCLDTPREYAPDPRRVSP